ncbi:uncharacterized protein PG986_006883 [Apiospora aurea]|uniref:Secreted protein n=1 Tax=Apiospora aurea TaxID=335848 RepID=A0ABR1QB02_9PEZI
MQAVLYLAAVLFGFCVSIASSMPVADAIIPVVAPNNITKVNANEDHAIVPVVAPNNLTKVNDDGGDSGTYNCFGTLDAYSSDCATLAANLPRTTDRIITNAHQCVGFYYGACVAKFCSNNEHKLYIPSDEFADHVSLLTGCTNNVQNGVMAPCSDDSFQGSCAWWQVWLQSNPDLMTQGGGKRSD